MIELGEGLWVSPQDVVALKDDGEREATQVFLSAGRMLTVELPARQVHDTLFGSANMADVFLPEGWRSDFGVRAVVGRLAQASSASDDDVIDESDLASQRIGAPPGVFGVINGMRVGELFTAGEHEALALALRSWYRTASDAGVSDVEMMTNTRRVAHVLGVVLDV